MKQRRWWRRLPVFKSVRGKEEFGVRPLIWREFELEGGMVLAGVTVYFFWTSSYRNCSAINMKNRLML